MQLHSQLPYHLQQQHYNQEKIISNIPLFIVASIVEYTCPCPCLSRSTTAMSTIGPRFVKDSII